MLSRQDLSRGLLSAFYYLGTRHVSGRGSSVTSSPASIRRRSLFCDWREYLAYDDDRDTMKILRRHENTGRPLGDLDFLRYASRILGRDLLPQRPGPKPKADQAS